VAHSLAFALICGLVVAAASAGLLGELRHGPHPVAVAAQLRGTDIWPPGTQRAHSFALRDQTGRIVWREYGIGVVSGQEHTAALYLVDRSGHIRIADAIPFLSRQLAGSVKALDHAST
jgi:hypothetical protein